MTIETHRPLPADRHLAFWPAACLAVRGGVAACDRCANACPVGVLKVGADGTALVGDCLHCGRCAAACPSGALVAKGFDEARLPSGNLPVAIECWKVPREIAGEQAVRVPCLGGLALTRLIEWLVEAGSRPLRLVDRGWCANCAAGTDGFAGAAILAALSPWLSASGLPPAHWPKQSEKPLPKALMPREIPSAERQIAMGRRAFFGRLAKEIARSERPVEAPAGPRAALRRTRCPLPAHERFLAALTQLAATQGRPLPPRALPRLEVSPACRDHGLCASSCPTDALVIRDGEKGRQWRFSSARCTGCGRCVAVCPEQALRLGEGGQFEEVVLRTVSLTSCLECGRDFVPQAAEHICPQCLAQRALAQSMFAPGPNVAGQ
ncbi:4Fe-4S dicluster domain-containing protein [Sulfuricystis multivorans]|uniref:4Fe-4S dicluster domain-containing protein n=1 Tax=Sulfuricystis multivorans TaxID=2211108 RepID=UPI000F82B968|nr:4Fe-4S dicluster domain-containing protein [Sulfuricystis multivorans]